MVVPQHRFIRKLNYGTKIILTLLATLNYEPEHMWNLTANS